MEYTYNYYKAKLLLSIDNIRPTYAGNVYFFKELIAPSCVYVLDNKTLAKVNYEFYLLC